VFVECVNTVLRPPYISTLLFQFLFDSSCKSAATARVFVIETDFDRYKYGDGAKRLWIYVEIRTGVGL
jgi:hypothetical protein